jgi:hypothetical protein
MAMRRNDVRIRATILLFVLTAAAFNLGRASEKLEIGAGTELTVLIAVAGALTAFGCLWLILVLLQKSGVRLVEPNRED